MEFNWAFYSFWIILQSLLYELTTLDSWKVMQYRLIVLMAIKHFFFFQISMFGRYSWFLFLLLFCGWWCVGCIKFSITLRYFSVKRGKLGMGFPNFHVVWLWSQYLKRRKSILKHFSFVRRGVSPHDKPRNLVQI